MGLGLGYRGSSGNYTPPNPNPSHFKVIRTVEMNRHLIAEIKYNGCTTYDGRKILVYDNLDAVKDGKKNKFLDPHFLGRGTDPIARFPATDQGWHDATKFVMYRYV